jgi:sulfite reductase alpha subunit-like flavoprotein
MLNPDNQRRTKETLNEKKARLFNLILTAITASGILSTAINFKKFTEHDEALTNANASLVENHTIVDNYKKDHAQEYEKATKEMLNRASDSLKRGNTNFGEQAPEEVPSPYYKSRANIEQQIGQAKFGKIQAGIYAAGSASAAALAAMYKKLKGDKKKKTK